MVDLFCLQLAICLNCENSPPSPFSSYTTSFSLSQSFLTKGNPSCPRELFPPSPVPFLSPLLLPRSAFMNDKVKQYCNPLKMTVSLFSPNYSFLPIWHFLRKICWIMTSIKMEALKNLYAELNLSCTFLILQLNLFPSVFAVPMTA